MQAEGWGQGLCRDLRRGLGPLYLYWGENLALPSTCPGPLPGRAPQAEPDVHPGPGPCRSPPLAGLEEAEDCGPSPRLPQQLRAWHPGSAGHCSLTHRREDTGGRQPLLGLGHAALPRSERTPCRLSARNPEDPGLLYCDSARHPARVSTQGPLPALSW